MWFLGDIGGGGYPKTLTSTIKATEEGEKSENNGNYKSIRSSITRCAVSAVFFFFFFFCVFKNVKEDVSLSVQNQHDGTSPKNRHLNDIPTRAGSIARSSTFI